MKGKSIAGLVLLALVATVVYVVQSGEKLDFLEKTEPVEQVEVRGYVGGEKMAFLGDPEVISILKERYGITFDATKAGSIEMVTTLPTDAMDCVWPSNQVASELFRMGGGTVAAEETLFNSPMVIYTWDVVAEALTTAGMVAKRGDTYFLEDFDGLVERLVA
ncbi:MAG: hypothetical protein MI919_01585, partial [Holophagales bacterium]|nr:hypothetical protein [Holophagales bacterium]